MEHLTSQDLTRLFEFLHSLYELRDHGTLKQHLVHSIAQLVTVDLCSYNEISPSKKLLTAYAMWPIEFPLPPDAQEIVGRYQHQQPVVTHYLTTGKGDVTKISDFMSYREFQRTDFHNQFYGPMGVPYCMGFGFLLNRDGMIGIGLHRNGKDFTERDRRILSELHPHILQAYGNAQAVTRLHDGIRALYGALDSLDSAVVVLSPRATISWATPRAERLLRGYQLVGTRTRDRLHDRITDWLRAQEQQLATPSELPHAIHPLVCSSSEGTLTIRLIRQGPSRILLLEEARTRPSTTALAHIGLSCRETEILSWVTHGKTNAEIGTILSISPRTVQKHLERIYGKLGVENRHAAMAIALETMRAGRSRNGDG